VSRPSNPTIRPLNRTGTIYVVALSFGLLLTVIGLGAITAARSYTRAQDLLNDAQEARNYALSATEVARRLIAADANWRTDYTNGAWLSNQPIGSGSFTVGVTNPNGALNNADTDPVVITGTGAKGTASQMVAVTLVPNPTPLTCLGVGLYSGGGGAFGSAVVQGVSTIGSGGTLSLTSTSFNGNPFEAPAIVPVNCTGMGTQSILATSRTLPNANALNYYTTHGTPITYASLGGGGKLEKCLLSPSSNPYGAQTNSQGIYVIDCGGQNLIVQNIRVVGTLVLLNTGGSSIVQGSVNMAPAIANYPALLVSGPIQLNCTNAVLAESTAGNLNPSGTPYGGTSNSTSTDSYPSTIQGLVYATGNVSISSSAYVTIRGNLIVGGALAVHGTLNLTYDSTCYRNPPPGFFYLPPPMVVSSGTWARVVN
jgi:hypothetical protein